MYPSIVDLQASVSLVYPSIIYLQASVSFVCPPLRKPYTSVTSVSLSIIAVKTSVSLMYPSVIDILSIPVNSQYLASMTSWCSVFFSQFLSLSRWPSCTVVPPLTLSEMRGLLCEGLYPTLSFIYLCIYFIILQIHSWEEN